MPTDEEVNKVLREVFPFNYSGSGYFRKNNVAPNNPAEIIHGMEANQIRCKRTFK
jgi:hypothetical protein